MDVLANLVTDVQLTNWMVQANGRSTANQDEWCYALARIVGTPCPAYDVGNGPTVQTTASTFLDALRNYELSANATLQGPGGSSVPAAALPGATPNIAASGVGLLGPTNCQFCIWLKNNPWAILVFAGAVYFGFFYKK